MLSVPINESAFQLGLPISQQYQAIIPADAFGRVLIPTILFGTDGLILLVGGALYSAYLFWRKRVLPNRVIGNVLIAIGALSVGTASELTHLGYGQFLYVGELVAAILMFAGFLAAARPQPDEVPSAVPAAAN
jgi:peptidoglycan/LPS O-acetylase OafA/YrhL